MGSAGSVSGAAEEIERKFLVPRLPAGIEACPHDTIVQGYLTGPEASNEVRLRRRGERYQLTVKSRGGVVRREGEIDIDRSRYDALWPFVAERVVEKVRYRLPLSPSCVAEIDVYAGRLQGLVTAEVEFVSVAASDAFVPPPWFATEVTTDPRYRNESLALRGLPG